MTLLETIKIPEETFRHWDQHFLPPYDLFYLADNGHQLPNNVLIMPIDELKANSDLFTLDVSNAFETWNIKSEAEYVAIIENEQFETLSFEVQQKLLKQQIELDRGNFYKWKEIKTVLDVLGEDREECLQLIESMSFNIEVETWVTLRQNKWRQLPWSFRKRFLMMVAESYTEDDRYTLCNLPLNPLMQSLIDQFPERNGSNCFATALATVTDNQQSAEWIIRQWIHPKTFLLGLEQRGFQLINNTNEWNQIDLQENDVVVWVNKTETPVHATCAVDEMYVFNKDGQSMFNPWLVKPFEELASSWDSVIQDGGAIHHYRKNHSE